MKRPADGGIAPKRRVLRGLSVNVLVLGVGSMLAFGAIMAVAAIILLGIIAPGEGAPTARRRS